MTIAHLPPARTGAPHPSPPAVLVYLGAPEHGRAPDLPALARAVERLVHSLAPDVVTRVGPAPPVADLPRGDVVPLAGRPAAPQQARSDLGDGLVLDLEARTLEADGRRQALTRREFDLLAHLHRRRGVALSRRELMTHVWGSGYLSGDRTVDVHVRRLRVKLGRHHHRITTLRGYGYRFD